MDRRRPRLRRNKITILAEDARVRYTSSLYYRISLVMENQPKVSSEIAVCIDWQLAFYDPDMLKQLGLPPGHNEKLQKQMEAELKQAKSGETKSANQK